MHAARCAEQSNPIVRGPEYFAARAHVAQRDSLDRFGTGHPSERCCKLCGRPTFDILDRYQSAAGEPYCSKEHHDAHKTGTQCAVQPVPLNVDDGSHSVRGYEPEANEPEPEVEKG